MGWGMGEHFFSFPHRAFTRGINWRTPDEVYFGQAEEGPNAQQGVPSQPGKRIEISTEVASSLLPPPVTLFALFPISLFSVMIV
jgi:hypothetical protein